MTALAADRNTPYNLGDEVALPVVASEICYLGGLVCLDPATGYAQAGASTAGLVFAGVAVAQADNSAGSSGDVSVRVYRKGIHQFVAAGLAITDVGSPVYITDDQTVTLTPGSVRCGTLARFTTATVAHVDIEDVVESGGAGSALGGLFTMTFSHGTTIGTSAITLAQDLEMPVNFIVLAGFAKCQTAPSSTYVTTCTLTDGSTASSVTITGTATTGEDKAINNEYAANTDFDVTVIDDNASAATDTVEVTFICRALG